MQDQKRNDEIESSAATVEEAISEALLRLGARRDEVEITVLEEGKSGVLGVFGRRAARVLATRKKRRSRGRRGGRRRSSGRGEGRRGEAGAREASPPPRQRQPRDAKPEASGETREGGRGRGRDGGRAAPRADGGEGGREDGRSRDRSRTRRRRPPREREERPPRGQARPSEAPAPTAEPGKDRDRSRDRDRGRSRDRGEGRDRRRRERRDERPAAAERPPSPPSPPREDTEARPVGEPIAAAEVVAPRRGLSPDDAAQVQRETAEELMRRSGFPSRCAVVEDEYNQIKITVDSDSAAVLIGRRGSTIDAVEHLVERMANQAVGGRAPMNLDINNYRHRREGQLVANAEDAARQMLASDKDVHTPPLSARERRIVHMAIARLDGVTTYTAGFGAERHVVVTRDDGRAEGDTPDEPGTPPGTMPDPAPEAAPEAESDETA